MSWHMRYSTSDKPGELDRMLGVVNSDGSTSRYKLDMGPS